MLYTVKGCCTTLCHVKECWSVSYYLTPQPSTMSSNVVQCHKNVAKCHVMLNNVEQFHFHTRSSMSKNVGPCRTISPQRPAMSNHVIHCHSHSTTYNNVSQCRKMSHNVI